MRLLLPCMLGLAILGNACKPAAQDDDDSAGSPAVDAGVLDAGPQDAAAPDATAPDAAAPDAAAPDASVAHHATCGNGRLDSLESCDGTLISETVGTCDSNFLGNGQARCTPGCTLDVSGCEITDYCEGNGFYNDDTCDACERLGGHADPACASRCGADGFCASWFDSAVGMFSCEAAGFPPDPDCGVCGNGQPEGHEYCDGTSWREVNLGGEPITPNTCEQWSYAGGGTLNCFPDCTPDFSGCIP